MLLLKHYAVNAKAESYLYDKQKETKKTNKKLINWIDKHGKRTPWWLKVSEQSGYYF